MWRKAVVTVLPMVLVLGVAAPASANDATDVAVFAGLVTNCVSGNDAACAQAQTVVLDLERQLTGCALGTVDATAPGAVTINESPYIGPSTALGCGTRTSTLLDIVDAAVPILICYLPPATRSSCQALDDTVVMAATVLEGCAFGTARAGGVNLSGGTDGLACETLADFVIATGHALAALAQTCTSGTSPACAEVLAQMAAALDAVVGCVVAAANAAGLRVSGGVDPGCGAAIQAASELVGAVRAAAEACVGRTDNTCRPIVAAATALVDDVAGSVTRCINGSDATCDPVHRAVELVSALVTKCVTNAAACVTTPSADQLAVVAKAAIEAKNMYMVSGAAGSASPSPAFSFAGWFAAEVPDLEQRRADLTATRIEYTWQSTSLDVLDATVVGAAATLVAHVSTRLGMAGILGNTGVPEYEGGGIEMHFVFTLGTSGWTLQRVDHNDVGGLYYQGDTSLEDDVTDSEVATGITVVDAASPVVVDADASLTAVDPLVQSADALVPPGSDSAKKAANRAGIVSYALRYSGDKGKPVNTSYRKFDQDCTNFVSQAMFEGGLWPKVDLDWSNDHTKEWWYSTGNFYQTSWTVARHFYAFVDRSGWATPISRLSQFRPGDILQADMANYHPGKIRHSTIVTKRDSAGNIFLTYHTADRENVRYADFYRQIGKGSKIYGWDVN